MESMENPKVLVVDDNPVNIDLLRSTLKPLSHCRFLVATSAERALELMARNQPDLVLLDVMMPGMNGFELCQHMRATAEYRETPVIFVTAKSEDISTGFRVGGNDYISKPINAEEVLARVQHQLERLSLHRRLNDLNQNLEHKVRERTAELAVANRQLREEVKERRYMQDRLQYLATHDFITHLYNRNALDDFVTSIISEVQLHGLQATFLQMDLDRFRLVNESCGCIAGDELLRQVADLVTGLIGKDDFFARLGGDKFALVCRGRGEDDARKLAQVIQQELKKFDFLWEGRHFNLAAVVALVPVDQDIVSFDQLMLMADELIYHLKKQKLGLMSYRQIEPQSGSRSKINWALRLMDAMKQKEFRVHYQKLVPLQSPEERPVKIETLVRLWDEPSQRLIFPDEFIPAAERYNLIADIDRWMIDNTLDYLASRPDVLSSLTSVAINLSALSIREPGLADFIENKITGANLDPAKICFELTETEAIVNMDAARDFIERIHQFGCRFALDDFGSGFSSFNYLRELPFDVVKIDGVFVRDMDRNPSHLAMVKSIVEVGRQLNKEIVAEFVETEVIAELLKSLGVEWGQGYHFHKPEDIGNL